MKLLYTSDIHTNPRHLHSILAIAEEEDVDGIIIGGDLIPHQLPAGYPLDVLRAQAAYLKDTFVPSIVRFKNKKDIGIYLDMANDDFICNRYILEAYQADVFYLLHMQRHPLTKEVDILGYMNVPPTPFRRKDWEKPDTVNFPYPPGNHVRLSGYLSSNGRLEETVIDVNSKDTIENDLFNLSKLIENPFIFVSHVPPYNTPLDVIYSGINVGSLSVRSFIEKWSSAGKMIASLHGHIHESPKRSGYVSTTINNMVCINPGQESGSHSRPAYVVLQLKDAQVILLDTEILTPEDTKDRLI